MSFRIVPRHPGAWRASIRPTEADHRVTSLELLFDLVFVFAFTQVTAAVAADPSWAGAARGLLLFAILWWAWCSYAWLGNHAQADEGLVRAAMAVAMAAMMLVALAIPEAWDDLPGGVNAPLTLAAAVAVVRLGHLAIYFVAAGDDGELRRQLVRTGIPVVIAVGLLLAGGFADGQLRPWWWAAALVVDYSGIYLTGAQGWRLQAPGHFAERHGLIVIVALGESIVAIGVGIADLPLSGPVIGATVLALSATVCLWWVYFDVAARVAERRLGGMSGPDRARLGRDSYTYLHFPMVAGVLAGAVGVKKVLNYVADPGHGHEHLTGVPAWLLVIGPAAYLLGLVAFRLRNLGSWSVPRLAGAVVLLLGGMAVPQLPVMGALGLVAGVLAAVVLFEVLRYREIRHRVRHEAG